MVHTRRDFTLPWEIETMSKPATSGTASGWPRWPRALLGSGILLCLIGAVVTQSPAADEVKALTPDVVKALQTSFDTERAQADQRGLTKMFSPEWFEKADALAKHGGE